MKSEILFYIACLVLFFVPLWFIRHKVYDDGVLGRISLAFIVIGSFVILGDASLSYFDAWWTGGDYRLAGYRVEPEQACLVVGFAVFITWHLFRFHRRVVRCMTPVTDPEGVWPPASLENLIDRSMLQKPGMNEHRKAV